MFKYGILVVSRGEADGTFIRRTCIMPTYPISANVTLKNVSFENYHFDSHLVEDIPLIWAIHNRSYWQVNGAKK